MAIVGGTDPGRRVLAEICHYIFLLQFKPFCCIPPPEQKIILKIQNSRRGEKEAGEKGTELTRQSHLNDEADAQTHDDNQKVK